MEEFINYKKFFCLDFLNVIIWICIFYEEYKEYIKLIKKSEEEKYITLQKRILSRTLLITLLLFLSFIKKM